MRTGWALIGLKPGVSLTDRTGGESARVGRREKWADGTRSVVSCLPAWPSSWIIF